MKRLSRHAGWLLVVGYFVLMYLLTLDVPALWSPDELRYGEISRELLARGDWVVPHFNGLVYFEKPIMGYWLNALAQLLMGQSNLSVRIMTALSALGCALCIMLLVRRVFGRTQGVLSGAMYLGFFIVAATGTYSTFDSFLAFWLTATFAAFYLALEEAVSRRRRCLYYLLAGVGCAGAFLTKGFLALALPFLVVVTHAIVQRRFRTLLCYGGLSVLAALLVTLPWAVAIQFRAPDFWRYFFWVEHIHRFFSKDAQHAAPFWFFVPVMLAGLMPWTPVAFLALSRLCHARHVPLVRYAALWAILPFLFFSLSRGKLPTYLLPCMAPMAILITHGLVLAFRHRQASIRWLSLIQGALFLGAALVVVLALTLGRLPLGADETYKAWLWVVMLMLWGACLLLATRARRISTLYVMYLLAPVGLFCLQGPALPDRMLATKKPEALVRQVAPYVDHETVLVADYPTLMSAFDWYLKRDDVYLFKSKGELEYGLSYPQARHRFIRPDELSDFVARQRRHHEVMLALRQPPDPAWGLPPPDRLIEHGPYRVLLFDREAF